MVQGVTLAHKGLAPSRLISYFRKRKMPMLGTHIGFAKAGVKFTCGESFANLIRKKPFRFFIFCNFKKTKMAFAQFSVYRMFCLS